MRYLNAYYGIFGISVTNPTRFVTMTVICSAIAGSLAGAYVSLKS